MSGAGGEGRGMPLMFVHSSVNSAGLSFKAYRVLGQLHQMSERYDHAFPSVETLAEAIGANRKTVHEALAELVAAGFIVRTSRPGTSSLYRPVRASELNRAAGGGQPEKRDGSRPEKRATPENGAAQEPGQEAPRKTGRGVPRKTGQKGNLFKVIEEGTPEFPVLAKPAGEEASGGGVSRPKPAAAAKAPKAADPRHREITSVIGDRHQAATGQPLPLTGRDVKALQTFLAAWKGTAEEFLATAGRAWLRGREDPFARNCLEGSSLAGLCARWPQILAELDRAPPAPPRPPPDRPSAKNPVLKSCNF